MNQEKQKYLNFIRRNNPGIAEQDVHRLAELYVAMDNGEIIADPFIDSNYFRLTAFRRVPGVVNQ